MSNRLTIDGKVPSRIMLAGIPLRADMFRYDFRDWVVTDPECDIDVSLHKVVIRRFRPNTCLMHSPSPVKDASGSGNTAICAYVRGARVRISGLDANASVFSSYKTLTNNHGAGSDLPRCKGLCMYPYSTDCYLMMERMYTWESCWSAEGVRNLPPVADYNDFRHDGGGHGYYGIFHDYSDTKVVPAELHDFNTWARANGGSASSWFFGLGLYTGNTDALDDGGYIDISEHPITIELIAEGGIDISSVEVWKLCQGEDVIYEKESTIQNRWINHGLARLASRYNADEEASNPGSESWIQVDCKAASDLAVVKLPMVTDWQDHILADDHHITWNNKALCPELWEAVREWYASHVIPCRILHTEPSPVDSHILRPGIFHSCGIGGTVTVNLSDTTVEDGEVVPNQYIYAHDAFAYSNIRKVILNSVNGCRISVGHDLFRHASELEEIESNMTLGSSDFSGTFEFCGKLSTIPANLLCYKPVNRQGGTSVNSSICGYIFEYCGITRIPIYNADGIIVPDDDTSRYDEDNIMVPCFADQLFNGADKLVYVGPVIDMINIVPSVGGRKTFSSASIQDIRIKHLNHGTWRLDGTGDPSGIPNGLLSGLNADSVAYLFDNLCDLTKSDPEKFETDSTCPRVSSAELRCPASWSDKVSDSMLSAAKSKGWSVYIGGLLRQ